MKNIVIFGDTGFIGNALVARLLQQENYKIFGISRIAKEDVENYEHFPCNVLTSSDVFQAILWIKESKRFIDAVIYLCGLTKHEDIVGKKSLMYRLHTEGVLNAVKFAKEVGAKNFVYVSSGKAAEGNFGTLHSAKIMAEECATVFPNAIIARPFNVYGRGQNPNYLIPYVVRSALTAGKVELETISTIRDFVHVDDVAHALQILADITADDLVIADIGSGKSVSVGDVVATIAKLLNKEVSIVCNKPKRIGEINREYASNSKSKLLIDNGYSPRNLEKGIIDVINEYKEKCK